jgi:hypothetical protein
MVIDIQFPLVCVVVDVQENKGWLEFNGKHQLFLWVVDVIHLAETNTS